MTDNDENDWEKEKPFPWVDSGLIFLIAMCIILAFV